MRTTKGFSLDERLLALTRQMLACAQASEWEKLAELEQSRLPIFNLVFAQGVSDNVELARQVLSIDEEAKRLAEAGIPAIRQEILSLRKSSKANTAYQSVQNSATGTE